MRLWRGGRRMAIVKIPLRKLSLGIALGMLYPPGTVSQPLQHGEAERRMTGEGADAGQAPDSGKLLKPDKGQVWRPDQAALNEMKFRLHFAGAMAGYGEGVFYVIRPQAQIFLGPDSRFEVVGNLVKGDYIHGLEVHGPWLKIGRSQYVNLRDVRNARLRTRGLEPYQIPPEDLNYWREQLRMAKEKHKSTIKRRSGGDRRSDQDVENSGLKNQPHSFSNRQNSDSGQEGR